MTQPWPSKVSFGVLIDARAQPSEPNTSVRPCVVAGDALEPPHVLELAHLVDVLAAHVDLVVVGLRPVELRLAADDELAEVVAVAERQAVHPAAALDIGVEGVAADLDGGVAAGPAPADLAADIGARPVAAGVRPANAVSQHICAEAGPARAAASAAADETIIRRSIMEASPNPADRRRPNPPTARCQCC